MNSGPGDNFRNNFRRNLAQAFIYAEHFDVADRIFEALLGAASGRHLSKRQVFGLLLVICFDPDDGGLDDGLH